jgi:hypothetical protein
MVEFVMASGAGLVYRRRAAARCAGPVMIEWPDASSAEKLEHWLAQFRRKDWFTLGNETEIVALYEAREARRQI